MPLDAPTDLPCAAGESGPLCDRAASIADVTKRFGPARTRIKAGTTVTFTNVGDIPHDATALKQSEWTTGALAKGESKAVTFNNVGIHYYICTPHPWMYGQIIVE